LGSSYHKLPLRNFRFRVASDGPVFSAVGRHLPRNRNALCGHNDGAKQR
jgi:hypothetical protein